MSHAGKYLQQNLTEMSHAGKYLQQNPTKLTKVAKEKKKARLADLEIMVFFKL